MRTITMKKFYESLSPRARVWIAMWLALAAAMFVMQIIVTGRL